MSQVKTEGNGRAVAIPPTQSKLPELRSSGVSAGFFDLQSFELMQRVAKGFAASTLVPKAYQGNSPEAIGNCMIALNLARRIGADPLMVMQNLTVVQGRPTWSSQFLIASANTCGRFTAIRYEFFGTQGLDDWGCRASAIEKSTGEMLTGADITIALAKKEGWFGRNGSKWQSMPQQMLIYRAGAWWVKAYAPELSMGLMTAEEAQDAFDITPPAQHVKEEPEAPKTIESRLDAFAHAEEDTDPPAASDTSTSSDADGPAGDDRQTPPADQPASSEAAAHSAEDDAGDRGVSPKIADAMDRGRAARRDGHSREVPKMLQAKPRHEEAQAYLKGWDEEDLEIKAAESGTV